MKHHNEKLARLSRRMDPLWGLLARGLRLRNRRIPTAPTSILLVELHLLGDMVMLIPLLRVVRRSHPHAHIGLMAGPWSLDVLADTGLVDEFIPLRAPWISKTGRVAGVAGVWKAVCAARVRQWDWAIDVRGDVRNVLLAVFAGAQRRIGFNFTGGGALLTDTVPDDGVLRHIIDHHAALAAYLGMMMTDEEHVPSFATSFGHRAERSGLPIVGFHFGASMALRRMPPDEAAELLSYVHKRGASRLILVDAADTIDYNAALLRRLDAGTAVDIERWQGRLADFKQFLRGLDKFYAMDSGPAHLAAALGVDTTVFFGPHLSFAVRPRGRSVVVIERADIPCRPCDQHTCTNVIKQQCLMGIVASLRSAAS